MFKVNNRDARTTSFDNVCMYMFNFEHIVNFEHLVLLGL